MSTSLSMKRKHEGGTAQQPISLPTSSPERPSKCPRVVSNPNSPSRQRRRAATIEIEDSDDDELPDLPSLIRKGLFKPRKSTPSASTSHSATSSTSSNSLPSSRSSAVGRSVAKGGASSSVGEQGSDSRAMQQSGQYARVGSSEASSSHKVSTTSTSASTFKPIRPIPTASSTRKQASSTSSTSMPTPSTSAVGRSVAKGGASSLVEKQGGDSRAIQQSGQYARVGSSKTGSLQGTMATGSSTSISKPTKPIPTASVPRKQAPSTSSASTPTPSTSAVGRSVAKGGASLSMLASRVRPGQSEAQARAGAAAAKRAGDTSASISTSIASTSAVLQPASSALADRRDTMPILSETEIEEIAMSFLNQPDSRFVETLPPPLLTDLPCVVPADATHAERGFAKAWGFPFRKGVFDAWLRGVRDSANRKAAWNAGVIEQGFNSRYAIPQPVKQRVILKLSVSKGRPIRASREEQCSSLTACLVRAAADTIEELCPHLSVWVSDVLEDNCGHDMPKAHASVGRPGGPVETELRKFDMVRMDLVYEQDEEPALGILYGVHAIWAVTGEKGKLRPGACVTMPGGQKFYLNYHPYSTRFATSAVVDPMLDSIAAITAKQRNRVFSIFEKKLREELAIHGLRRLTIIQNPTSPVDASNVFRLVAERSRKTFMRVEAWYKANYSPDDPVLAGLTSLQIRARNGHVTRGNPNSAKTPALTAADATDLAKFKREAASRYHGRNPEREYLCDLIYSITHGRKPALPHIANWPTGVPVRPFTMPVDDVPYCAVKIMQGVIRGTRVYGEYEKDNSSESRKMVDLMMAERTRRKRAGDSNKLGNRDIARLVVTSLRDALLTDHFLMGRRAQNQISAQQIRDWFIWPENVTTVLGDLQSAKELVPLGKKLITGEIRLKTISEGLPLPDTRTPLMTDADVLTYRTVHHEVVRLFNEGNAKRQKQNQPKKEIRLYLIPFLRDLIHQHYSLSDSLRATIAPVLATLPQYLHNWKIYEHYWVACKCWQLLDKDEYVYDDEEEDDLDDA